jgi:hypothetical protein
LLTRQISLIGFAEAEVANDARRARESHPKHLSDGNIASDSRIEHSDDAPPSGSAKPEESQDPPTMDSLAASPLPCAGGDETQLSLETAEGPEEPRLPILSVTESELGPEDGPVGSPKSAIELDPAQSQSQENVDPNPDAVLCQTFITEEEEEEEEVGVNTGAQIPGDDFSSHPAVVSSLPNDSSDSHRDTTDETPASPTVEEPTSPPIADSILTVITPDPVSPNDARSEAPLDPGSPPPTEDRLAAQGCRLSVSNLNANEVINAEFSSSAPAQVKGSVQNNDSQPAFDLPVPEAADDHRPSLFLSSPRSLVIETPDEPPPITAADLDDRMSAIADQIASAVIKAIPRSGLSRPESRVSSPRPESASYSEREDETPPEPTITRPFLPSGSPRAAEPLRLFRRRIPRTFVNTTVSIGVHEFPRQFKRPPGPRRTVTLTFATFIDTDLAPVETGSQSSDSMASTVPSLTILSADPSRWSGLSTSRASNLVQPLDDIYRRFVDSGPRIIREPGLPRQRRAVAAATLTPSRPLVLVPHSSPRSCDPVPVSVRFV